MLLSAALLAASPAWSQAPRARHGGGVRAPHEGPCIPFPEEKKIRASISRNTEALRKLGRSLPPPSGLQKYRFYPQAGRLWEDIFPNNFLDLDNGAGAIVDYHGTQYTYDGHTGIDSDLCTFTEQSIGVPVYAVLDGMVVAVHDGEPDMQTSVLPGVTANYVIINHGGSHETWYFHLKNGSVAVSLGQNVKAGTQLGLTASSGYSTGPHLHFESRNAGAAFEPFTGVENPGTSQWVNQPPFRSSMYIRDLNITSEDLDAWPGLPYDTTRTGTFGTGDQMVYLWGIFHNLPASSTHRIRFLRPNGSVGESFGTWDFGGGDEPFSRWSSWWWWLPVDFNVTGTWILELTVNGTVAARAPIRVTNGADTNRAPEAVAAVAFDPPAVEPEDVVFCRVPFRLIDDVDYDVVRYRYEWSRNGTVIRDSTNAALSDALPADTCVDGDVLVCRVTPSDGAANAASVTTSIVVGAGLPVPDIAVKDPADTDLTDGGPAWNAGSSFVGDAMAPATFTITNAGTGTLNIQSITKSGVHSANFTVGALSSSSILPGGTATFTVTFNPSGAGERTATLLINSNDTGETPFDIPVKGTGITPYRGVIAVNLPAATVIEVDEPATNPVTVDIPISRTGGADGTVGFTITASGGSATSGTDYTPPTALQTMTHGVVSKVISITILPSATSEPNETFNVTISSPTGGATLGTVKTVSVRIVDSVDASPPNDPVINAPALNALVTLTPAGQYLVSGTAKDDKGVDSVQVKLNGNAVGNATLTAPGMASTNWSLLVSPVPDVNTLAVQSTDTQSKTSTEVSRSFRAPGPLAVTVNAAHGSVTTGYAPTSYREIGASHTIKATAKTTPAPGFVFDRWVIGGGYDEGDIGATFDSIRVPSLTFTMRVGLTLTAQFIANPFAVEAGAYDGLVRTATGYTPSMATEGHFHVDVQSSGAFSGRLTIDGLVLNVGGAFDNEGVARFGTTRATSVKVTRTTKPAVEVSLKLEDLDPPGDTMDAITGIVTQKYRSITTGISDVLMRRAAVPADILTYVPTGASALFTAVMTPRPLAVQPAGLMAIDYPQGHSLANITVTKTGGITFVGTMADGTTPLSISSTISKGGDSPLFAQMYGKLGFLSGLLHLDHTQDESDLTAVGMLWSKPYSDIQHYPYGWPEVVTSDLRAARYLVPPSNSVLHAPDDSIAPDSGTRGDLLPIPGANANAQLTFKLPSMTDVLKDVKVSPSDGVTKMNTADASFSLTITRTTGRITGFFTNPGDNTKPTYHGIMYQKGTGTFPDPGPGAYGWFLTLPLAPKVKTYDGQGGSVELKYKP